MAVSIGLERMAGRSNPVGEHQRRFTALVDEALFAQLWRQASRLALCREDAEDLLQETLITAFQRFGQLRDKSKLRRWIHSILRSKFLNHVRSVKRHQSRKTRLSLQQPGIAADPATLQVQEALLALPPDQRWLLTSHYMEGITTAELAAAQRTTVGNIQQRLHRARRALLKIVIPDEAGSSTEVA